MSTSVVYGEGDMETVEVQPDFLPEPGQLVYRDENIKESPPEPITGTAIA